ncbi:DNA mismatch repair protein msh6 [Malassezia sp. CBS 17886]|nr:DNA mismatch repair protein msh6 [Malassezia sp. CBS 17886]
MPPSAPSAPKQASLLGFFKKMPGERRNEKHAARTSDEAGADAAATTSAPATSPHAPPSMVTPPPSADRAHAAAAAQQHQEAGRTPTGPPRQQSAPSKRRHASHDSPTSMTPPPSSDVAEMDETEDAPPDGRRRAAARRVRYVESQSEGSESSGSEEPPAARGTKRTREEDDFALSDDGASGSDDSASAAPSEADPTPPASSASESEADVCTPQPPRGRRANSQDVPPPTASAHTVALSRSHLTKAERRVEADKKRRMENEQAYSFLLEVRDRDGNRPGDLHYDKRTLYIPPGAWRGFTPFEKQFWEIKQNHFDTMLFFQKGKFYELYEEDAMIGHRELDLKLTDRVKMKMVGVPEASLDMFTTKLLALGYKVGRVDQVETAVAKGMRVGEKSRGGGSEIVRRELRDVVTSGTIVDDAVLADDLNSYCVSIKEVARAGCPPRFGICTLDASTAEFRLCAFDDDAALTRLETLLRALRTKEVLHEKGAMSTGTLRLLRSTLPTTCETTMLRAGTEFLDAPAARARTASLFPHGVPDGLTELVQDDAAASALGGMLWYLEQLNLDVDLCASGNFAALPPPGQSGTLILDAKSLVHLNVLQNDTGTTEGTLHRLLNRCVTPFGRRLFKLWLAAPLTSCAAINARLDAVEDVLREPSFAESFAAFARTLPDLERLQTRIAARKCRPRDFLRVLHAFSGFRAARDELTQAADTFRGALIRDALASLPDVTSVAEDIRAHFHAKDDGSFFPRPGEFAAYDAAVDEVAAAERRLDEELDAAAETLRIARNSVAWKHVGTNEIYQVEVPAKTKVPANWTLMSQTKAAKRYYSPRGRELVRVLKEARETRLAALRQFQDHVYAQFRAEHATFARAVRIVAQLDCVLSLAKGSHALGTPSCRPELVDGRDVAAMRFRSLRHPCMAPTALSGATSFIPNDIQLGDEAEEVMVLTGGNMAGKSTTARTAATAAILAQLGCLVPAEHARIAPIDRIASRIGATDQLFRNHSTFMVEMLEASKIMREATPRSLVIMDELGRGTSTFDGQAIAFAVLHHLIAQTRCLCFFMTHYTHMARSLDTYPRVVNRHMEVIVDDAKRNVLFTYRMVPGIAESSYGTQVARIAGVPDAICAQAADVSQAFLDASTAAQARRARARIPLETLSDFASLVAIGQGYGNAVPRMRRAQLDVLHAHAHAYTQGPARSAHAINE